MAVTSFRREFTGPRGVGTSFGPAKETAIGLCRFSIGRAVPESTILEKLKPNSDLFSRAHGADTHTTPVFRSRPRTR